MEKIDGFFIHVFRTWHGKDEFNIYMMFDYVCGGELFSYLRSAGKFPSSTCKLIFRKFFDAEADV